MIAGPIAASCTTSRRATAGGTSRTAYASDSRSSGSKTASTSRSRSWPARPTGCRRGSAESVIASFDELVDADVVAIVGPSISDNGLIVRDLADAGRIPSINYTGGAFTRGEHMFHYQVGSLEEEPVLLAEHLPGGLGTVAVVLRPLARSGRSYDRGSAATVARTGDRGCACRSSVSPLAEEPGTVVEAGPAARARRARLSRARGGRPGRRVGGRAAGWDGPVVTNSALMFGYGRKDWRAGLEGWVYVDTVADGERPAALCEQSRPHAASPIGVAGYDIGRLLGEGLVPRRRICTRPCATLSTWSSGFPPPAGTTAR